MLQASRKAEACFMLLAHDGSLKIRHAVRSEIPAAFAISLILIQSPFGPVRAKATARNGGHRESSHSTNVFLPFWLIRFLLHLRCVFTLQGIHRCWLYLDHPSLQVGKLL